MKGFRARTYGLAALLLFQSIAHASAQGSVTLPVAGTAAAGASFTGTLAVTRFEARGGQIVAKGFLSGTLTRGNRVIGTALAGEVTVPVSVQAGGVSAINVRPTDRLELKRVAFSSANNARAELSPAQLAACPVVDVVLGPFGINVLGVDLTIQPVAIQLVGEPGTPLGDLVCQVNELIGNVAGLVGVLNTILNLLILLLGGGFAFPVA